MCSNFCGKNDVILLKNSAFHELQVLIELIFQFIFQFSILILKESSKWCLIFSCFSADFEKLANISSQELSLRECLISKNIQIIRKKADTVLISVYLSCAAKIFKVILQCVRDLELAKSL